LRCFGSRHCAWIVNLFGRASLSMTDRRSAAYIAAAARQEDKAQEKQSAISGQQPVISNQPGRRKKTPGKSAGATQDEEEAFSNQRSAVSQSERRHRAGKESGHCPFSLLIRHQRKR